MNRFVALIAALVLCRMPGLAQEWPQWRGVNRDGVISPFREPGTWPEQLKQEWQVNVGIGHSSPVVAGTRVYVFARQGEEEVATCLDLATGKQLWRSACPAPYTMNSAARSHGKGPKSTPVLHAGKLCTFGISGILSCYDAATGRLQWRAQFDKKYAATAPIYGAAASPVVDRGLLIIHVGGDDAGALTAFNLENGKESWSWTGDGPGYASPMVVESGGTRQIVTQSTRNLVGVSAADGKLLWKVPFTTAWEQNIVTPIVNGENLIFSGLDKGVMAIRLRQSGGKWTAEKVWENPDVSFYMSTPVVNAGTLFGLSHKGRGRFVALEAGTGKTLWATTGREGDNAALLTAGEKLFALTTDGEFIVAKADAAAFKPLRRYTVAKSATWAHPVLTGTRLLVKDEQTLTSWRIQ